RKITRNTFALRLMIVRIAANILNLSYFCSTNLDKVVFALIFLPRMDSYLILPACYLPPIAYFSVILNSNQPILLEKYEHYPKQTYRNRTAIYSANGKLDLIIPVQRGSNGHTQLKDVKISYEADWQRLHWM